VLVVDDNPTNRRIFRLQLERWGLMVEEAASAAEALALLDRGEAFDLAILDHQMPGMDGAQLAREIRVRKGKTFPLLMASSIGSQPTGGRSLEVDAFVTKPVKRSQLLDTVAELVARIPRPRHDRPAPAAPPRARALSVLVAEDNLVNQKVALRMLEKLGCRADVAGNGQLAVSAAAAKRYDLIFMDVQMPVMDGLEATRAIRRAQPLHGPYIVAMTADVMPGDRERCIAAGMDDYMPKPVRIEALEAILQGREDAAGAA
jgi:CheY-like chemotaxis protein